MWQDYLSFRRMITPVFIQAIFWIGVGIIVISGLIGVIVAISGGDLLTVFATLVFMVVFPVIWRIYCELLIVIFRINESLSDINNAVGGGQPRGAFPVIPATPPYEGSTGGGERPR